VPDMHEMTRAETRRDVEARMRAVFRRWGYRETDAPVLMDYETLRTAGSTAEDVAYKLVDEGGRILVLRPEMTAPIVSMAARRRVEWQRPLRVCYFSRLFRRSESDREFFQAGAELLGGAGAVADAEMVGLCCEVLVASGIERYQVNLGHTGVLTDISSSLGLEHNRAEQLRTSLAQRDIVAVEGILSRLGPVDAQRAEVLLPYRGALAPDELDSLASAGVGDRVMDEIAALFDWVLQVAPAEDIGFDPSLVRQLDYYTGPVFEVYCPDTGDLLGGGGRYDGLMGRFGVEEPATGFAVDLHAVQSAAAMNGAAEPLEPLCLVLVPSESSHQGADLARKLRANGFRVILETAASPTEEAGIARARCRGADYLYLEDGQPREVSPVAGEVE